MGAVTGGDRADPLCPVCLDSPGGRASCAVRPHSSYVTQEWLVTPLTALDGRRGCDEVAGFQEGASEFILWARGAAGCQPKPAPSSLGNGPVEPGVVTLRE